MSLFSVATHVEYIGGSTDRVITYTRAQALATIHYTVGPGIALT
jgi:hypothetical protein